MYTQIQFQINSTILLSLNKSKDVFIKEMLYNNALMLYRKNELSLGKAAEMAGYDRLTFIQKLQFENEPIFDYDNEMIKDLISGAQTTLKSIRKKTNEDSF